MLRFLFYCLLLWILTPARAQKKQPALPEAVYINQLAAALAQPQPAPYVALMPSAEVLYDLQPVLPKLLRTLEPDSLEVATDGVGPVLARNAERWFQRFRDESDAMRLRWNTLRLARYELIKQPPTRDSLLEQLAPDRYMGYVFFLDPMRQKTFAVKVRGLFGYGGKLWGGALAAIYPAETIAAYEAHAEAARRAAAKGESYVAFQPEETDDDEDEDWGNPSPKAKGDAQPKGVVAERRYFTGFFDDEIPVHLFIRGYRGNCQEGVCRWNAIMLVGDEDDWVGLSMVKKEESWLFTEVPNKATMELKPEKTFLKGTWTATDDNTGYEVELVEKEVPKKKLSTLEDAMDNLGL